MLIKTCSNHRMAQVRTSICTIYTWYMPTKTTIQDRSLITRFVVVFASYCTYRDDEHDVQPGRKWAPHAVEHGIHLMDYFLPVFT